MQIRSLVRAATAAAILGLVAPTVASAQQTLLFNSPTGDLGTSHMYTLLNGWGTVTATSSSGYDLLGHNPSGTSEDGLGVCATGFIRRGHCTQSGNSTGEIGNNAGFITLSMSLLSGVVPISFELSSVQTNDLYSFEVGPTCGGLGSTTSGTGPNNGSPFVYQGLASTVTCIQFNPPAPHQSQRGGEDSWESFCQTYFNNGDYLLMSLTLDKPSSGTSTTVPEPASMTLLATGLVGMAAAARRRRNKK